MELDHGGPFKAVSGDGSAPEASPLRKLMRFIPNMLTLSAVVFGLSAIRLSGEGQFALAMTAILGAALLDAADGFLARKLSAESAIGAELDSLADFLNFGVAPAMLLYDRHLYSLGMAGWGIAAIYVIATGLRLARFNVQSESCLASPRRHFAAKKEMVLRPAVDGSRHGDHGNRRSGPAPRSYGYSNGDCGRGRHRQRADGEQASFSIFGRHFWRKLAQALTRRPGASWPRVMRSVEAGWALAPRIAVHVKNRPHMATLAWRVVVQALRRASRIANRRRFKVLRSWMPE